jgi:anti-sigma factor RsiW
MTDHSPVTAPVNDDRLERYLLGLLDEPARDEVEAQAFGDPAVADALDDVETALVDAYVSGALSGGRREAFRRALATRPRLQVRVRVAHALGRREPRARVARWWLPVLGAAAALVLAASVWLLERAAPPEPAPAQTASVTDAPAADTPTPEAAVPPPPDTPQATPRPPAGSVFAVTRPVGVSRAADIVDIRVPSGSTHLQVRVPIAPGDDFARYRVRLRGPGGREIGVADPAPLAPDRTVWLTVERGALADGLHEIAVEGLDAQGTAEPLTLQQVRVTTEAPRQ